MPNARGVITDREQRAAKYRNWAEYQDEDDGPTHPFTDLIQRDPVVCDNCFLLRYSTLTFEWWRGSMGWLDYERWIPLPDTAVEVEADTSQGTRLACSNCGHRIGAKTRPVLKENVTEWVDNISKTLDAKEISHDRDRLFEEVRKRNTSENQGRQDSHVFAPSVKRAVLSVR